MKKLFCSLFGLFLAFSVMPGIAATSFSCGAGYVLATHDNIDGITAKECVKLWCRDLETNKPMGVGTRVSNGYKDTSGPVELTDGRGNSVECFGERKWCSGDVPGVWSPEYGAYTRGDDDSTTYKSYQKGGCFSWRLEKPECPAGQDAVLKDGEWVCAASSGASTGSRASSVRRTGTLRRVVR